ncbi:MAG: MAPEG family protein [Rhodoferax sp.]|nr:MAPEG family protein [Rhodoferax sp.]
MLLYYFFSFGTLVGRARAKYGVKAPAVTGNGHSERTFRVHVNTLEHLAGFPPALFIAGQYWSNALVAGVGLMYLIGRFVYRRSYIADPTKRKVGFLLTVIPTFFLLASALIGAVMHSST